MYVSDVYTTVPVELRQARIVKETSNHCEFIHASNLIRVEQGAERRRIIRAEQERSEN